MAKQSASTTGIFVSAFLANHVIPPEQDEEIRQFDLKGAGHRWWKTDKDSIVIEGDLYVMIHFIDVRRGTYRVRMDVKDYAGKPIILIGGETLFEVSQAKMNYSFNLPLYGLELPIGHFYLWIYVENEPKATVSLDVFGPRLASQ